MVEAGYRQHPAPESNGLTFGNDDASFEAASGRCCGGNPFYEGFFRAVPGDQPSLNDERAAVRI